MGWTQEDIAFVYNLVKESVNIGDKNLTRSHAFNNIKDRVKKSLTPGYYKGYKYYSADRHKIKKFSAFIKNKHYKIGLESKEMNMLDKMINDVVDGLGCNESSLSNLNNVVGKMNNTVHVAKHINNDCEDIICALDRISDFLDDPCQNTDI